MWPIKDKDGNIRVYAESIEYNGKWLDECSVTTTIYSPVPINFQIGDYIEYRGERFEINYNPGKIKTSARYKTGDAFKYENVKFNSFADELTRCDFLDVVLNDNQIHFTGLPKFSFYAPSVKEIADRIQANLDRCYPGLWSVEVHPEFADKTDLNISVDCFKVWDALKICVEDFGAYFTITGRKIVIGTAGVPTQYLFTFGPNKGLYEIDENADSNQMVCTRVRAYGSTRNLPHRYYSNLPEIKRAYVPIHSVEYRSSQSGVADYCVLKFRFLSQYVDLKKCIQHGDKYWFAASINNKCYAVNWDSEQSLYTIGEVPPFAVPKAPNYILRAADMANINSGTTVCFEVFADNAPGIVLEKAIPDNMAVNNLMLPGFPQLTQDPYLDSRYIDRLGVREHSVFFDGSDGELDEIYPSIEGMTAEELKASGIPCNSEGELDVLVGADTVNDNGVGNVTGDKSELSESESYFKVKVKDLGFDINDYLIEGNSEPPTISFKTGKLGGRDFEIFSCKPIEDAQKNITGYELELKRVYDDSLKLWFPYKDYNAALGDKFVLLYISMPDAYIEAASQRLLAATQEWLSKHEYSRSVYNPKIDEIFMARQHDEAMASNGQIQSLHDTLKEGMLMLFEDDDFGIDASVFIETLTIKEKTDAIPVYEVTLKEEPTVGTLDKIKNQIDSLMSGKAGGYNAAQIRSLIDAYGSLRFLSKIKADRTPYDLSVGGELITETNARSRRFADGLTGEGWQIDKDGNIIGDSLTLRKFLEVPELRYNRVEVYPGISWYCAGGGIIESVHDDGDGIFRAILKLEDGEIGQVAVDDFCMGIWHMQSGNAEKDDDSGTGDFQFAGYTTIYFRITAVEGARNEEIYFELREDWPKNMPVSGLHFVCYSNETIKERQKSRYATRSYERYLSDVNGYNFSVDNIMMQFGDLSNLQIGDVHMGGYSAYLKNVYFEGVIKQLEDARPYLTLDTWGDPFVGTGKECVIVPRVVKAYQDVTAKCTWTVITASETLHPAKGSTSFKLDKSALGGRDSFEVSVTATYTDDQGVTYTATANLIIRDYDSLKGQDGTFAFNLLKGSKGFPAANNFQSNQYLKPTSYTDADGFAVTDVHISGSGSDWYMLWCAIPFSLLANGRDNTFVKGHTYTLSFDYIYGGEDNNMIFRFVAEELGNYKWHNLIDNQSLKSSATWARAYYTFVYGEEIDINSFILGLGVKHLHDGETFSVRRFCISEGGSNAWAPAYEEIKGQNGENGKDGKDAETVEIDCSPEVIHCNSNGLRVDTSINVKAWHIKGDTRMLINTDNSASGYTVQYYWTWQDRNGATQPSTPTWTKLTADTIEVSGNPEQLYQSLHLRVITSNGTTVAEKILPYIADGKQGAQGNAGTSGAVIRVRGAFVAGQKYYAGDERDEDGQLWLDVVWCDNAFKTDRKYFECVKTGLYSEGEGPSYSDEAQKAGWKPFSYISALLTDILLAENAEINFLNGQEIIIGEKQIDGTYQIWGRLGSPLPVNHFNPQNFGIIQWCGATSAANATYALYKSGLARFGQYGGKRIEIDPEEKEVRVYDEESRNVAMIDGDEYTIDDAYNCRSTLVTTKKGNYFDSDEIDLGSITAGEAGAKYFASLNLLASGGTFTTSSSGPGSMLGHSQSRFEVVLYIRDTDGAEVDSSTFNFTSANHAGETSGDYDSVHGVYSFSDFKRELLDLETSLKPGTYRMGISIKITPAQANSKVWPCTLSLDFQSRLQAGNDPKCHIGKNGFLVANSTDSYLAAGMRDKGNGKQGWRMDSANGMTSIVQEEDSVQISYGTTRFTIDKNGIEAVCGERGFRVSQNKYEAIDSKGEWRTLNLNAIMI